MEVLKLVRFLLGFCYVLIAFAEMVKPEVMMEIRMEEEEMLFLENEVAATQTSAVDMDIDEDGILFVGSFQKEGTPVAVRSTDSEECVGSPEECDGGHSGTQ